MNSDKQTLLIEKTSKILGKNTKHMKLMLVIEGLVNKIEEAERKQLSPVKKESPFVDQYKKAKYMDLDD